MDERKGYILLYRKVCDNPIWTQERFSKGQAFIDLLLMCSHNECVRTLGKHKVNVKRGQIAISERFMAKRWQWSRGAVRLFIDSLRKRKILAHQKTRVCTLITILNWHKYQNEKTTKKPTKSPPKAQRQYINERIKTKKIYIGEVETKTSRKKTQPPYDQIISFLNSKTGKKFSPKAATTKSKINARFSEGFTLSDFKRVITIKAGEWKNDAEMQKYLRPETLFGTKFEGYLNQQNETFSTDGKLKLNIRLPAAISERTNSNRNNRF